MQDQARFIHFSDLVLGTRAGLDNLTSKIFEKTVDFFRGV
jgi:hypothetical protein